MSTNENFTKLFDATGQEVVASLEELLSIELNSLTINDAFFKRLVGASTDLVQYWLVSSRKGYTSMLVHIRVWGFNGKDSGYAAILSGVAGSSQFEIESTFKDFEHFADLGACVPLPSNVTELTRQYVRYDSAARPSRWQGDSGSIVTTLNARKMRRRLIHLVDSGLDEAAIDCLVAETAGKELSIDQLVRLVVDHLGQQVAVEAPYHMISCAQYPKLFGKVTFFANLFKAK